MKILKQIAISFLLLNLFTLQSTIHSTRLVHCLAYFQVRVQNLNVYILSPHFVSSVDTLSLCSSCIVNEPQAIFPTVMLLSPQRKLNQQKKHLKHNISP